MINNFAPAWLAAGLLAGLLSLRRGIAGRGRRTRQIALLSILGCGTAAVGPELAARVAAPRPADTGPLLRIVQFNIWKDNPQPREAARWLLAQRADLLILEEVPVGSPMRAMLAPAFSHAVGCLPDARCSTLILARRRPIASGGLARGDPENRRAASAAWARFAGPIAPFTVVGVHLNRPWPWPASDDVAVVTQFIRAEPHDRLIVAGDFNRTPWSFALQRIDRGFGLPRPTRALASWPARLGGMTGLPPLLPIDHVYAGPQWRVLDVRRGPDLGSDHYPIIVTLALPSAARA